MIDLHECIEKLASEDEADRSYAAEDIGYANQAEGVQPLLDRLPIEPSRAVREAIFAALIQIDRQEVIEGAVNLLDSEDSFLRNQAVELLRARGAKAVPCLEMAFRNGDNDRRKFVIDILARLRDDSTSQIYDLALSDPDLNVVITAVENLGASRNTTFKDRIELLIAPQSHPMLLCACIETLAQIGDAASINTVRARLGGPTGIAGYLHASYLNLLGAKGRQEDVIEIASFIGRDGLEAHVLNALTTLRSRFRNLELPVSLAHSLQKAVSAAGSPLLAYQAVRLMAPHLNRDAVFDFITGCLQHPEKAIRIGAIHAMREGHSPKAEAVLRDRLSAETDEEVLQALTR